MQSTCDGFTVREHLLFLVINQKHQYFSIEIEKQLYLYKFISKRSFKMGCG